MTFSGTTNYSVTDFSCLGKMRKEKIKKGLGNRNEANKNATS
jgi:hypothetical protein